MSTENSEKRVYVNRRSEFNDLTIEQMLKIRDDLKVELSNAEKDSNAQQLVKELLNKRVRVYSRLRALGYNAKEIRSKNAAAKKQSI